MNRQQQEKIISLLDVAGSTIVDIFYNHMYDRAIAMKEKTEHNITDCYRSAILDYVKSSDSTDFYKVLMNSIHYYTKVSTIYHSISLVNCIDLYASLFVPEVYLQSLTEKQKNDILSMVLRETIKEFSNELLTNHLAIIIDEHQDDTNIGVLQDVILRELIKHRDKSYLRFVQCEKKKSETQKSPKVDKQKSVVLKSNQTQKALIKLTRLYKESIDDKTKLKKRNAELQSKYKSVVTQCKDLQTMLLNQIRLYKTKESELSEYLSSDRTIEYRDKLVSSSSPESNSIVQDIETRVSEPDYDGLFNVQYADD